MSSMGSSSKDPFSSIPGAARAPVAAAIDDALKPQGSVFGNVMGSVSATQGLWAAQRQNYTQDYTAVKGWDTNAFKEFSAAHANNPGIDLISKEGLLQSKADPNKYVSYANGQDVSGLVQQFLSYQDTYLANKTKADAATTLAQQTKDQIAIDQKNATDYARTHTGRQATILTVGNKTALGTYR